MILYVLKWVLLMILSMCGTVPRYEQISWSKHGPCVKTCERIYGPTALASIDWTSRLTSRVCSCYLNNGIYHVPRNDRGKR